jgi:hypothetical protein
MMYVPEAKKRAFLAETDSGHLDLPRAKRAGFVGAFFRYLFLIQIRTDPMFPRATLKSVPPFGREA